MARNSSRSIGVALSLALCMGAPCSEALAGASLRRGGTRAEFESDLDRLEHARRSGDWKGVREKLERLLAEHEGAPYVAARIFDVLDDYRDAAFYEFAGDRLRPDFGSLVQGRLRKCAIDGSRAKVELEYPALVAGEDFEEVEDSLLIHPAVLLDGCKVTARCRFSSASKWIPCFQILGDECTWVVCVGWSAPGSEPRKASIVEYGPDGSERYLANEANRELSYAQPIELVLACGKNTLQLTCNGRLVVRAKTTAPPHGRLALQAFPESCELSIRGSIGSAWLQGLVDEVKMRLRADFAASGDPTVRLPEWLHELYRNGIEPDARPFPESEREENEAVWEHFRARLERGDADEALAQLDGWSGPAPSPALDAYLRAILDQRAGRSRRAREESERARAAAPSSPHARLLAQGLAATQVDAEQVIAACIDATWGRVERRRLARRLLESSRLGAARSSVEVAILAGVPPKDLADVHDVLTKAIEGPRWVRTFESTSDHYRVRSDIDRNTCLQVARELEYALNLYNRDLARDACSRDRDEPYAVYVFSGMEGYSTYCEGLFGDRKPNTAGIYSPVLEQLVIWNLPAREEMLRTVRHEGLHQYLDAVVPNAPRWLDEGLAEYFETASLKRGVRTAGTPNAQHVALLSDEATPWTPLAELVTSSPEAFYARGEVHYAEAWALVHYLLRSDASTHRRFDAFFDALRSGEEASDATKALFGAGEQAYRDLETAVRAHLRTLHDG